MPKIESRPKNKRITCYTVNMMLEEKISPAISLGSPSASLHNKPRKQPLLPQRVKLHHIGLGAGPGLGGVHDQHYYHSYMIQHPEVLDQLKKDAVRLWIMQCDARLLLTRDGDLARYGPRHQMMTLGSDVMLCDRIHPEHALQYYTRRPDELPQDMLMCHNICPVFLLHGFVDLLRNDADLFYGSHETLLMLHVLKTRLQQQKQTDIAVFLKRLFQLIECSLASDCGSSVVTPTTTTTTLTHQKRPMERYDHYLTIVTVFMTSNVDFMRRIDDGIDIGPWSSGGDSHRYEFCVDDVKRRGAIKTLFVQNLLCGDTEAPSSVWTMTYLELQMNTHCHTIERQWMSYWESSTTGHKMVPRALELDVPAHDIADANQFVTAVLNGSDAIAMYAPTVIDALYGCYNTNNMF